MSGTTQSPSGLGLRLVATYGRAVDGGKGGGDDGGMEERLREVELSVVRTDARLTSIERDVGEVKSDLREIRRDMRVDFRLVFGAIIGVALGLAGILAKGFHWL